MFVAKFSGLRTLGRIPGLRKKLTPVLPACGVHVPGRFIPGKARCFHGCHSRRWGEHDDHRTFRHTVVIAVFLFSILGMGAGPFELEKSAREKW